MPGCGNVLTHGSHRPRETGNHLGRILNTVHRGTYGVQDEIPRVSVFLQLSLITLIKKG